jgi:hypothetical protein
VDVSLNYAPAVVPADTYERIFALERSVDYPMVTAFEERMGFAVDRERLEAAARVLCCPYKAAAPHWQHGRVLYAATRRYLTDHPELAQIRTLDVGTAKGYSALCVRWAVEDAGVEAQSVSVDVMPPDHRVRRGTIAEVDGLKTLAEILAPWPEASRITFVESTGIDWLERQPNIRIHVAFVDGKHTGFVVRREGVLLAQRQQPGDLCIFDDVHIGDVSAAVTSLHHDYTLAYLQPLPKRAYAIGVRR